MKTKLIAALLFAGLAMTLTAAQGVRVQEPCTFRRVEVFTMEDVRGALDLDADTATARPPVLLVLEVDTAEVAMRRVYDYVLESGAECVEVRAR